MAVAPSTPRLDRCPHRLGAHLDDRPRRSAGSPGEASRDPSVRVPDPAPRQIPPIALAYGRVRDRPRRRDDRLALEGTARTGVAEPTAPAVGRTKGPLPA